MSLIFLHLLFVIFVGVDSSIKLNEHDFGTDLKQNPDVRQFKEWYKNLNGEDLLAKPTTPAPMNENELALKLYLLKFMTLTPTTTPKHVTTENSDVRQLKEWIEKLNGNNILLPNAKDFLSKHTTPTPLPEVKNAFKQYLLNLMAQISSASSATTTEDPESRRLQKWYDNLDENLKQLLRNKDFWNYIASGIKVTTPTPTLTTNIPTTTTMKTKDSATRRGAAIKTSTLDPISEEDKAVTEKLLDIFERYSKGEAHENVELKSWLTRVKDASKWSKNRLVDKGQIVILFYEYDSLRKDLEEYINDRLEVIVDDLIPHQIPSSECWKFYVRQVDSLRNALKKSNEKKSLAIQQNSYECQEEDSFEDLDYDY